MLRFKSFLKEQTEATKSHHHLNMHHIHDGEPGYHKAIQMLNAVHDHIKTGGHNNTKITTKYDESPSIVFGHHPQTGKFFVGTGSAFNKNSKINHSEEDIDHNHGESPALAQKLKHSLKHLKKVAPKKGVYGGNLMYTHNDIKHDKGSASFTPNQTTYTAHGAEAKKAKNSKLGIVVHTKYHGPTLEGMNASADPDLHNFNKHPDVNVIDPEVDVSKINYSPEDEKAIQTHMAGAVKSMKSAPHDVFSAIKPHSEHLNTYLDDTVKTGEKPSADGYKKHLQKKFGKEIEKLNSERGKVKKREELGSHLQHVDDHSKHLHSALEIHHHLQQAKNALVRSLSSNPKFETKIGNTPISDGGFFVSHPAHGTTKLVNQENLSKTDLLRTRNK